MPWHKRLSKESHLDKNLFRLRRPGRPKVVNRGHPGDHDSTASLRSPSLTRRVGEGLLNTDTPVMSSIQGRRDRSQHFAVQQAVGHDHAAVLGQF